MKLIMVNPNDIDNSNPPMSSDIPLDVLANSIRKYGLMEPVTITETKRGKFKYKTVFGFRRISAVKSLGWKSIPAVLATWAEITGESQSRKKLTKTEMRLVKRKIKSKKE